MNLFLPEVSLTDSVKCLDDRRLIKQILEVAILMDDTKGYSNHPVKVFYKDRKIFLAHYGYLCCCEYFYRFEKIHKSEPVFEDYLRTHGNFDFHMIWWKEGLYAAGSKNAPDCIRETEPYKVRQLFRQKLITKWKNDKIPPKWTNCNPPRWYTKEEK